MNKDHSTITEQYTISELNRHGRVFHGTKIPVGRDPETGKVRQFSYVKHTKDEVSDAILSDTRSPLQGAVQEKLCTDITIGELADRFWQSKQAFMSSSYKYSMNYWLDSIKRYLNDLPAADLSATRAELFQTELMLEENGPSNCSINSIMSVLGSVMEFAKGEQIPVFNPIKYISRLPKTNKKCRLRPAPCGHRCSFQISSWQFAPFMVPHPLRYAHITVTNPTYPRLLAINLL